MFAVYTISPHQTGALFSWLVVNRGPCSYVLLRNLPDLIFINSIYLSNPGSRGRHVSFDRVPLLFVVLDCMEISVLVHPNTNNMYRDHTELVSWMGKPWPLNTDYFEGVVCKE
jgi:DOPA 4,5-dioxygenase